MDLGVTSRAWPVDDTSWLASRKGLDTCRSVTLDVATFTEADHYPNGALLSGLPLAPTGTDGLYGLATGAVVDGHLRGSVAIGDPAPARVGAALQWEGVIDARFLPVAITTAQADASAHIRYENVAATVPEAGV